MSSEALERAQEIRAAIHSPGWHREEGLAALDALLAEVARLERERDEWQSAAADDGRCPGCGWYVADCNCVARAAADEPGETPT